MSDRTVSASNEEKLPEEQSPWVESSNRDPVAWHEYREGWDERYLLTTNERVDGVLPGVSFSGWPLPQSDLKDTISDTVAKPGMGSCGVTHARL